MSGPADREARIRAYAASYRADYGFESVMVAARQRLLRELLSNLRPDVVVEVGCGSELLCQSGGEGAERVGRWVIVEASHSFAQHAREQTAGEGHVAVIEGFLEQAVEQVHHSCRRPPNLVICSSVLHEVSDPDAVLAAARALIGDGGGVLHVNVPNALSLHRRLARRMGLVATEYDMTERNQLLQQTRIFDPGSLRAVIERAGFRVTDTGGYVLKPFTHQQMEALPFLGPELLDGLWQLGRDLPELASEIFVNAEVGS